MSQTGKHIVETKTNVLHLPDFYAFSQSDAICFLSSSRMFRPFFQVSDTENDVLGVAGNEVVAERITCGMLLVRKVTNPLGTLHGKGASFSY